MRVFVAGATGVIGIRLVPLLVAAGHDVAGMTRFRERTDVVRSLGAKPVAVDVYDVEALHDAIVSYAPNAVVHQLTDLPEERRQARDFEAANARIRREGTRNLLSAARAARADRFVAQSVAWDLGGDAGAAVEEHERAVLDAGGVIVRYGRLYGPGTYFVEEMPPPPRINVDEAARRTVPALKSPSGIMTVTES